MVTHETRLIWDKTAEAFVLPEQATDRPHGPQTRGGSALFLCGPIPLPWLEQACRLPGKALAVSLAIWFLYGLKRSATFKLRPETMARFHVGRKAGYRALEQLQSAGLIRVRRQQGQAPEVTLLKVGRNPIGSAIPQSPTTHPSP